MPCLSTREFLKRPVGTESQGVSGPKAFKLLQRVFILCNRSREYLFSTPFASAHRRGACLCSWLASASHCTLLHSGISRPHRTKSLKKTPQCVSSFILFTLLFAHSFTLYTALFTYFDSLSLILPHSPTMSKSSKKKKQAPREYSLELGTEPTFSNMGRSSVRQGTQDSDESWLRYYLADNTPTPLPKKKQAIKPQSKESDDDSLLSPEKFKIKPSRQSSVANIKSKGTGPHDNKLAKAQGDYREPSLRRGSGMTFNTPHAFKKIPSTETSNTSHDEAQSTESVAGPSTQKLQPSSGQKPNGNDPVSEQTII